MPPGDTVHIPVQSGIMPSGDTIYLPDSFYGTGGYQGWILQQEQLKRQEEERQARNSDGNIFFLLFIVILFIAIGWKRLGNFFGWKQMRIKRNTEEIIDQKGITYDNWLQKYNPYYNSLSPGLKKRFLQRTIEFMGSKEFRFHFMQPEEHIPVLISGAAVQLTFGLKRFLIGFFPVINVVQKAYSVSGNDKILEGHVRVDDQSINISWNNFISDYEDYTDSQNVGLHEMAHAISYDFLYGYQENRNAAFISKFKEYIQEAGPVFKELLQGKNDMLDEYGSLNVEEFWAVSVETFFENPQEFRTKMTGFYDAMSKVLNQDPLLPGKIINKNMAGLAN